MSTECEIYRINLGAYVLGALDAAERSRTEAHLSTCPTCRNELVDLAGLPGLLRRLIPAGTELEDEFADPDEPFESPGRTESTEYRTGVDWAPARIGAEDAAETGTPRLGAGRHAAGSELLAGRAVAELRRRRMAIRRQWITTAAAAIAAIGLLFGAAELRNTLTGAQTVAAVDSRTHVQASVRMTGSPSGTVLSLRLAGVGEEEHCALVAVARDGHRETAATWVASYAGFAEVKGQTSVPIREIAALEVVTPTGQQLVRIPVT